MAIREDQMDQILMKVFIQVHGTGDLMCLMVQHPMIWKIKFAVEAQLLSFDFLVQ
jgi:hypothetical protein